MEGGGEVAGLVSVLGFFPGAGLKMLLNPAEMTLGCIPKDMFSDDMQTERLQRTQERHIEVDRA